MQFETLFLEVRRLMLETSSCESLVGVGVANADQASPTTARTQKRGERNVTKQHALKTSYAHLDRMGENSEGGTKEQSSEAHVSLSQGRGDAETPRAGRRHPGVAGQARMPQQTPCRRETHWQRLSRTRIPQTHEEKL